MVLNPNDSDSEDIASNAPKAERYFPILDDDNTPGEVFDQIDELNSRKASGCDELSWGIMKFLSNAWIILLILLFNVVFKANYPSK